MLFKLKIIEKIAITYIAQLKTQNISFKNRCAFEYKEKESRIHKWI
jgi:hypothetical protein